MSEFYQLEASQALQTLQSDAERGLSFEECQQRLQRYGENALPTDEGINWMKLIIGQFTEIMVVILIIAAIISAFIGEASDVIVIMIIVVLNAALGIYQEYQAEQALAALSAMQVPQVRVRRGLREHAFD